MDTCSEMAKLTDCSEPYDTEIHRIETKNHDRLMAIHHTGLNVKRTLLKYYLSEKNLSLLDYLSTWHDCTRFDDVKHAISEAKNVTVEELRLHTIDTLLTYHCNDLFWKSCLVNTSVEEILNKYKEDLYNLYQTGGGCSNEYQGQKKKYLTKDQWTVIFKDQGSEEDTNGTNDSKLSTTCVTKGLTERSFDKDMNFVILSTVCSLFKSVHVLTEYQTKISRIAIEHEMQNDAFDILWKSMETNIRTISCYCLCADRYDEMLDSIKTCIFGRLQAQENRKCVLKSTLDHPTFFQVSYLLTRFYKVISDILVYNYFHTFVFEILV